MIIFGGAKRDNRDPSAGPKKTEARISFGLSPSGLGLSAVGAF
jgi:hypothetical protein